MRRGEVDIFAGMCVCVCVCGEVDSDRYNNARLVAINKGSRDVKIVMAA